MKHLQATFPISRRRRRAARRHVRRGDVKHLQATFPISRRRRRWGGTRGGATWSTYKPHSQYRGGGDGEEAQEEGRREASTSHIPNIAAGATTARRHERRGDVKHLQATFPISRRGRRRLGGTRGGATWNIYKPHSQYRGGGDGEEAREEGWRETSTSHIPNIAAAATVRRHERRGDVKHLQATFPISRRRRRWGGTRGGTTWSIYKPHSQYRGGGDNG